MLLYLCVAAVSFLAYRFLVCTRLTFDVVFNRLVIVESHADVLFPRDLLAAHAKTQSLACS
jgi:hypothetical protein